MQFDWDEVKATANVRKHGVSFFEAMEVLRDPLALTVYDDEYSESEDRFVTIGYSAKGRLLIVFMPIETTLSESLAPDWRTDVNERTMKMEPSPRKPQAGEESMKQEYDFRRMRGAVRGKYAERYRAQEPTVRILGADGTVEEGLLSDIRKKNAEELPSPWTVFDYEVQQFFAMINLLSSENTEIAKFSQCIRNAIVESALLHARQLVDIILSRGKSPDDVNLVSLLPNYHSDRLKELAAIYGDRRKKDSTCWVLNKHLAHATAHRGNSFDYTKHLRQMVPVLQAIVSEVASLRSR